MGVLDNIVKLKAIEQEQANKTAEMFMKGLQMKQENQIAQQKLSQDYQNMNLTAELGKKKINADMLSKGLDFNYDTGAVSPAKPSVLEAIQQASMKPKSESDLYYQQLRTEKMEDEAKTREDKAQIDKALDVSMEIPEGTDMKEWIATTHPVVAETVKGLIDYTTDPNKFASIRNSERIKYLALARKVDPSFNMMEYPKRQKYINSITDPSTKAGSNIVSLNTVAHHIAQLDEEIEANKGSKYKPAQSVLNWAREMTGNPNITDEKIAMKVVKDEFEKALAGTVTQEALKDFESILNPNLGYDAKKNAIKTLVEMVRGRIEPYRQGYKSVMGKEENGEIIQPESWDIFNKYLGTSEGKKEEAPSMLDDIGSEWVTITGGGRIRMKQ